MVGRMAQSSAPAHLFLPLHGIEEWDKPGQEAHDPDGLAAFIDEVRSTVKPPVVLTEISCHINDQAFADAVLAFFDQWLADEVVTAA